MPETISCPFCSAKYELRPDRVRRGVKRARCVRCGNEFGVSDAVAQLYGDAEAPVPEPQAGPEPEPEPVGAPEPEPPQEDAAPEPEPEAAASPGSEAAASPEPEAAASPEPEAAPGPPQEDAAPEPEPAPEPDSAHAPPLTEAALGGDTTNFSPDEIRAAIASSMAEQGPAPQQEVPAEVPSKLKVRMDGELAENMTKEEVASWVEEGKIKGHHLVAHQFSENWLEAAKVPFLKPVFAKLKPPKRGLFEGLFGRK